MYWSKRPFIRICFFFILGILIAYYFEGIRNHSLLIAAFAIIILVTQLLISTFFRTWRYSWLNGTLIALQIISMGSILSLNRLNYCPLDVTQPGTYVGKLVSEPRLAGKTIKMIIELRRNGQQCNSWVAASSIMVYMNQDSLSRHLEEGDVISFSAHINQPLPPLNPSEFNYQKYLTLNGIQYQAFLKQSSWKKLGHRPIWKIKKAARDFRNYLLIKLKANSMGDQSLSVAAAILLGYDELMDDELQQDFVRAGAMHILCVSGLHVGIIYLVMNFLLGFLWKKRWQGYLKMILLLGLIWFYAMITGLSPSVQRAAVMISLFIISGVFRHGRDSLNTLAASAFLLLVFDPLLLFHVGFQLSYMAVLGILLAYRPIYLLLYIKNKIGNACWSVVAVSIAAQLGTFPLAAHYFHFFPTYFLLSNLLIFPLSFLIISSGMLFIFLSWIPLLGAWSAYALTTLIFVLNHVVSIFKFLPFSGFEHLHFPWLKVGMVYMIIVLLFQYVILAHSKLLRVSLIAVLVLLAFNTFEKYGRLNQKKLVVYAINKHSAIDFVVGSNHKLFMDSLLLGDSKKINFHLKNAQIFWGLDDSNCALEEMNTFSNTFIYAQNGFVGCSGKQFLFLRGQDFIKAKNKTDIELDAIVLSGHKKVDLRVLNEAFRFQHVIIDGSVPRWKQSHCEQAAKQLGIPCHTTRSDGAYVLEL